MSSDDHEPIGNINARKKRGKIGRHLRREWYKYILQAAVVISGIIIAFALEKWHLNQQESDQFNDAYRLIAQELSVDKVQLNKLIRRFEDRYPSYQLLMTAQMTKKQYDSCYYCPRLVTSIYTLNASDLGFQHLSQLPNYSIGYRKDSLNYYIEKYYRHIRHDLPMWQHFIRQDIQENIHQWKLNQHWYYQREKRPEAMVEYQLNHPEHKNMVYVQHNLIYKNYLPLLKNLQKQANSILLLIPPKSI
jgi:hypothetical protein